MGKIRYYNSNLQKSGKKKAAYGIDLERKEVELFNYPLDETGQTQYAVVPFSEIDGLNTLIGKLKKANRIN